MAHPFFAPPRRLIGAAFLMDFAVGVASLGMTELGILLGASPFVLGLMGTVGGTAYTLVCLCSGRLSDRYGRRRSVLAGCLLVISAWVAVSHAQTPWQIVCLVPFGSIGAALFWPPLQAWLAELSGDSRRELNRNLGLFNILWCTGLMLGPIVCGYVWPWGRYWPFGVGIAGVGVIFAIAWFMPRRRHLPPGPLPAGEGEHGDLTPSPLSTSGEGEDGSGRLALAPAHSCGVSGGGTQCRRADGAPAEPLVLPEGNREQDDTAAHPLAGMYLKIAWAGNFSSWFASGVIKSLFPKLGDDLHFSPALVGSLIAAIHLAQLGIFWITRNNHRWQYRLWPFFAAQGLAFGGMVLAFVTGQPWLFGVAFGTAGICAGVTYVGSLFYSLHGNTDERGGKAGLHEAVLGSGILFGPLLGGLLANAVNLRAPFLMVAGVYVLATATQVLIWRHGMTNAAAVIPVANGGAVPVAEVLEPAPEWESTD